MQGGPGGGWGRRERKGRGRGGGEERGRRRGKMGRERGGNGEGRGEREGEEERGRGRRRDPASAGRFFTTSATWATPDMTRDVAKIKKFFKKKRKTEKENHRLTVSVASAPLASNHHPQSPL